MLILMFSILLFILSIVFIYIGNDDWDKEWLLYFGGALIIIMIISLTIEFTMLISKPIEYKNFKIEYDVVKETITSPEDIRDTNYTKKLIEINTKIKTNREYKDSMWCGIFFNKKIADLELLQKWKGENNAIIN